MLELSDDDAQIRSLEYVHRVLVSNDLYTPEVDLQDEVKTLLNRSSNAQQKSSPGETSSVPPVTSNPAPAANASSSSTSGGGPSEPGKAPKPESSPRSLVVFNPDGENAAAEEGDEELAEFVMTELLKKAPKRTVKQAMSGMFGAFKFALSCCCLPVSLYDALITHPIETGKH